MNSSTFIPEIPIGSPVIVKTDLILQRLDSDVKKELILMPEGFAVGFDKINNLNMYKIRLRTTREIYLFKNEFICLDKINSNVGKLDKIFLILFKYNYLNNTYTSTYYMKRLFSPFNFIKWLIYSFKDVF